MRPRTDWKTGRGLGGGGVSSERQGQEHSDVLQAFRNRVIHSFIEGLLQTCQTHSPQAAFLVYWPVLYFEFDMLGLLYTRPSASTRKEGGKTDSSFA